MSPLDPNAASDPEGGLFGLSDSALEARVHVIPVPMDATTSYRKGTAHGPAAVLAASRQVDLFDPVFGRPYETGIHQFDVDPRVAVIAAESALLAQPIIEAGGRLQQRPELAAALERVNAFGAELNAIVRERCASSLTQGRLVGILGGDHSVPFGALQACAAHHPGLGVLHFDAHADLRHAYEGFAWSHASIFANVLEHIPGVARVVQVGIRDFCDEELERMADPRVRTLFDHEWGRARLAGRDLIELVREWIAQLPEIVWVSFDVDGLDPALCPNTGTPVPGGLDWHAASIWLEELARSGRRIVGFDLCEVSPGPLGDPSGQSLDANVGARLLYRLIGAGLQSWSPES